MHRTLTANYFLAIVLLQHDEVVEKVLIIIIIIFQKFITHA